MSGDDFFAPGPVILSKAELLKYLVIIQDGLEKWTEENPGAAWTTEAWFYEWLDTKVFDPEERLKFAGAFFALPTTTSVLRSNKEVVQLRITRGENGQVEWDLAHQCEDPCPHRAIS